ncbi:hypothetical protein HPB52_006473 [Rhipicephalus sanguineus]|uniref:Uncharacterized protein n=1 Tax=Rhipicephalus sanguineus TaxID=34632 RepID=A0A9D4QHP7_RHISA|nr:hypothetical protein HPB52_006473 [Rhipicephalus sanguineus]
MQLSSFLLYASTCLALGSLCRWTVAAPQQPGFNPLLERQAQPTPQTPPAPQPPALPPGWFNFPGVGVVVPAFQVPNFQFPVVNWTFPGFQGNEEGGPKLH